MQYNTGNEAVKVYSAMANDFQTSGHESVPNRRGYKNKN